MRMMNDKHNDDEDNDNNDNTIIKRKQGQVTRRRDEDKG
jgi:hypothetical protein